MEVRPIKSLSIQNTSRTLLRIPASLDFEILSIKNQQHLQISFSIYTWSFKLNSRGHLTCFVTDSRARDPSTKCTFSLSNVDVNLKHILITGNFNVTFADLKYHDQLNISLQGNAFLKINLDKVSVLTVDLLGQGRLNIKGNIKKIVGTNIAVNALLDISEISSSGSRRSLQVELNNARCPGPIKFPPGMHPLSSDFLEPIETERQAFVRTSISFPHESSDCDLSIPSCLTCLEYRSNAMFEPCGHTCMCLVCSERLRAMKFSNFTCPLCREEINGVSVIKLTE